MATSLKLKAKFEYGTLRVTAGAVQKVDADDAFIAFTRHINGDWGDLARDDHEANELALEWGERLFSTFTDRNKQRFYITTEADRQSTTILLPEEY